jgi:hypothetical protein
MSLDCLLLVLFCLNTYSSMQQLVEKQGVISKEESLEQPFECYATFL